MLGEHYQIAVRVAQPRDRGVVRGLNIAGIEARRRQPPMLAADARHDQRQRAVAGIVRICIQLEARAVAMMPFGEPCHRLGIGLAPEQRRKPRHARGEIRAVELCVDRAERHDRLLSQSKGANGRASRSLPVPPFACPHCGQLLHFDARGCPSCGKSVAFEPEAARFRFFDDARGRWCCEGDAGIEAQSCDNARYGVCNWLVAAADGATLCRACRHNRLIPDLSVPGVLERWRRIEDAKRRVIFGLIQLGVAPLTMAEGYGLVFDFLYDPSAEQGYAPQLMTGHQAGVVTLNLIEADDVQRERMRRQLGEPYRTLVGHFRHEIGHYYWHRFVEVSPDLGPFRAVFGNETADYQGALQAHYAHPPAAGWEDTHVSAYATMHPWEDFAETFAHYLHIVDTLAVIGSFGLSLGRTDGIAGDAEPGVDFDPYSADTALLVERWIPLAFALNSVNRAMGQPDLYPFHMAPGIVRKLDFVNRLLAFNAGRWSPGEGENADLKAMIAALGHGVDLGA